MSSASTTPWLLRKEQSVFVAGHRGLVGSAIHRALERHGYSNFILRTRQELDLLRQQDVDDFFRETRPDVVVLAAAKVGGIGANMNFPAEFIHENLLVQSNVIDASHRHGVRQLLFLGSSCIYPKLSPQPIPESALLTQPLEPTNAPYAIAKIAGITMCEAYNREYGTKFRPVMPCNLYGPGDSFDLENSHVLPAFIRRFHEAKESALTDVKLWGTGTPRREFLYVDDLAEACVFLMEHIEDTSLVNIGSGTDLTIRELASVVADVVGFKGTVSFDPSKPDGTPRKLLDIAKIAAWGWKPRTTLKEGIMRTYEWYREHIAA